MKHVFAVQLLSCVWLFLTPWTAARQALLFFNISRSLLWFMSTESVIPPKHLILCCLPFAFSLSQHQGLLQWISSLHQVAKVLELQLQHQSFQWIFSVALRLTDLLSLLCTGLSRVFSSSTVQKHQFFSFNGPILLPIHNYWKAIDLTIQTFVGKVISAFQYAV